jgi:hypothetical protein
MKHWRRYSTSTIVILFIMCMTFVIQGAQAAPLRQQGIITPNMVANSTSGAPDRISSPTSLLFSYQGQLANAAGTPIASATLPMTFNLYPVATGGSPCWTEDHVGGNAISVQNGLFHALLGQLTAIPPACLTGDAYLELVVNGETLGPRELLTSVAYAVQAQDVTGVITGQYGGGITNGCGTSAERYYVGSLRYSDASVYEKLFVTVWGGGYLNTSLGKDFYSISSREGLKISRTRLFGATEAYVLKVYDNGTSYSITR